MRWMAVLMGGLATMTAVHGQAVQGQLYKAAPGPHVQIVTDGSPAAQIVLPEAPTFLEEFAANELQDYVRRISGAELLVVGEEHADADSFTIALGSTNAAEAAGIEPDEETMGRDGFSMRSVGGALVIRGRNDLGTVFGVYELLERHFGVRWYMPGEIGEVVPEADTLALGQIDLTHKPSFRVRWVGNNEWALHQRMNAFVKADGRDVGVNWKWHFHTFRRLMPPDEYYDEHPEYFALVNGERTITESKTHGNQLCTSNPEVVEEVAKNMIEVLDEDPSIEIIALSPNDGGGFCECAECQALDEPGRDWFAKYSRRLALFNNQVARIVKQEHPDVMIKVGAYAMYARPPLDEDWRSEDNLLWQLCHIYFCHNHPLGSDRCEAGETFEPSERFQPNQEYEGILDQWTEIAEHLFIYEYYTLGGPSKADLPWPLVHTIRNDIPYYRDRGAEGFYTQLSNALFYRQGINYYLAAKLAWNADLDPDALLADYFTGFYGPAAGPMERFWMGLEQAMIDWDQCSSYGLSGTAHAAFGPKVFTPEVMASVGDALEEAETLAEGEGAYEETVALARKMYDETQAVLADLRAEE